MPLAPAPPPLHPPSYRHGALPDVLPSVLAALGHPLADRPASLVLPPARRSVVVLLDGLGAQLLGRRAGHAPFLRSLLGDGQVLASGFPATTATSTASFGTGLAPGEHGLLGYQSKIPETGAVFDHLSWEGGPDPRRWQPEATVFELAAAQGLAVARVGLPRFDGSGLTVAALRGGRFLGATTLQRGVAATVRFLRDHDQALVYVYWGDIDKAGHESGCDSPAWISALEHADEQLRRLAEQLPAHTSLHITADHGMVDVPFDQRIDLAVDRELDAGIVATAGEPRAPHLYCRPGAAAEVAATWSSRFGQSALVRVREQAIADGWFGPTAERNVARIGDVVVAFGAGLAVEDSRTSKPILLTLLGMHGSMTLEETAVPLLTLSARAA
ncbi:MAG: nucleotide pyrophosphatase/phosphodiesterase family protein [Tetrasphaera sp.]